MPIPNQTLVQAIITEQTCGDACWHAREDICRCSCGGKNHGCLRSEDGQQPNRTRKIKGAIYELVAIQTYNADERTIDELYNIEHSFQHKLIDQEVCTFGDIYWANGYRMKHLPTFIKIASEDEVRRWPELSTWRDVPFADADNRPLTLWVRIDFVKYFKT